MMSRLPVRFLLSAALLVSVLLGASAKFASAERLDGFNVIVVPDHPFGSASAEQALTRAKRLGARAIAIVPFLWQPSPKSADIVRGADMPDQALRAAIRQGHKADLAVIVKPHVWIPQSWAGAISPTSESNWHAWFAGYRRAIEHIGRIAAEEHADTSTTE
jgi:hypothetical protein